VQARSRERDGGDAGVVDEHDGLAVGRRGGTIVHDAAARGVRAEKRVDPSRWVQEVEVPTGDALYVDDGTVGPRECGMRRRGRSYRGEAGDGAGRQERPQEATPPLADS